MRKFIFLISLMLSLSAFANGTCKRHNTIMISLQNSGTQDLNFLVKSKKGRPHIMADTLKPNSNPTVIGFTMGGKGRVVGSIEINFKGIPGCIIHYAQVCSEWHFEPGYENTWECTPGGKVAVTESPRFLYGNHPQFKFAAVNSR